jgi:hypothetical protein
MLSQALCSAQAGLSFDEPRQVVAGWHFIKISGIDVDGPKYQGAAVKLFAA